MLLVEPNWGGILTELTIMYWSSDSHVHPIFYPMNVLSLWYLSKCYNWPAKDLYKSVVMPRAARTAFRRLRPVAGVDFFLCLSSTYCTRIFCGRPQKIPRTHWLEPPEEPSLSEIRFMVPEGGPSRGFSHAPQRCRRVNCQDRDRGTLVGPIRHNFGKNGQYIHVHQDLMSSNIGRRTWE
jgi:hypothetical protein